MEITTEQQDVVDLFGNQRPQTGSEPEQGSSKAPSQERRKPRIKPINRRQMVLRPTIVENLVGADHPVRAIWEMLEQVDLSGFEQGIQAVEGHAGQATLSPQLLASLWIYAYSEAVSSARELSRMCEYEPGCQWLTGLGGVNYHALADFRVEHKKALDGLFSEVLGLLSAEGLVDLKQVTQDGTKIKANAGKDTFRREDRIREHLRFAEKQVEGMSDPRSEAPTKREAAARERAQAEKKKKLEQAIEELKRIREGKADEEKGGTRVSTTDPEARVMKDGNGGFCPAYNVQIVTDVANTIIVDVEAVQAANDWDQLMPAMERIEDKLGKPGQVIADAGYTSRQNIENAAEQNVDLIGPAPEASTTAQRYEQRGISADFHVEAFKYDEEANCYVCPAGKVLKQATTERLVGRVKMKYQARASDCRDCRFRAQCCPKTMARRITRSQDSETVKVFIAKMETAEAREAYRQRPQIAEFVNAWIKDKLGLRQFRLRGLVKVQTECLWVSLTYNIQQWVRLRWRTRLAVA